MRNLSFVRILGLISMSLVVSPTLFSQAPPLQSTHPGYTAIEPEVTCPTQLGIGVSTGLLYCDVMTGNDPAVGILIAVPPHRGEAFLIFDLHNRHTYSEEQLKAGRAFARYTAIIGVLTMDNTLLSRAAVMSEFRGAWDLVDRVGGGAGPTGVKAVAPTGTATITIAIPASENEVSLLGERLTVARLDGTAAYGSPGRPIAIVSNIRIEYRPAPARRPGQ